MSQKEIIVGIDLGTTNSSISVLENGKPKIIKIDGSSSMPSCVSIDDEGNIIVGQSAVNQLLVKPNDTHFSVKRHMGSGKIFSIGDEEYRAEEISAFILRKLREEAQNELGHPVKKAVITVPAYFKEDQRLATSNAAELAGLDCVRLLNEPTAAALAYNPNRGSDQNENILVYDLGGGTFDVSLVTSSEDLVEVKSSHGDTHLGGDDIDELLIDFIIDKAQMLIDRESLSTTQLLRLRRACEAAKRKLSNQATAEISEEYFFNDEHLKIEIFRHEFNELVAPLLEKTWTSVHAALNDAGLVPSNLNKILLVGGSTHMPIVSNSMEERLGITPQFDVNPDLIVTMGAALQAGIIGGEKVEAILVDISAHTYSTGVLENHGGIGCIPIIKRGSPLPCVKSDLFYTTHPAQDEVEIDVYQGESRLPDENDLIGAFTIEDLSTSQSELQPIICEYALDLNGMLKVTATEKNTGHAKTVTLDTRGTQQSLDLTAAKEKMAVLYEDELTDNDSMLDSSSENTAADQIVARAEKTLESDTLGDEDRTEITSLLEKIATSKQQGAPESVSAAANQLDDILFYIE
ncbi:MAG: Hsp70 family protein [Verrucomicrobiales bacterium]|nr:Hsp70 family protein [Verrucomicrobiales bacterium]